MYFVHLLRTIASGMTQTETKSKTKTARIVVIVYGPAEALQTHICVSATITAWFDVHSQCVQGQNFLSISPASVFDQFPLSYS